MSKHRPHSPADTRLEGPDRGKRIYKGAHAPLRRRFWAKVEVNDGCWLWRGATKPYGYGNFCPTRCRTVQAHRFAYELLRGPIPAGMELDHVKARGCDSPACVNPAHLEPVVRRENIRRGDSPPAVNRRKTHCWRGHPFDDENTVHRNGGRHCRACRQEARRLRTLRDRELRMRAV